MGTSSGETDLPESFPLRNKDDTCGIDRRNYGDTHVQTGPGVESCPRNLPVGRKDKGWEVKWKRAWFDFSQNTTLHGVNRVTEETPFTIRR